MIRVLHAEHAFSDRFVAYMLARKIRLEQDLVDQLLNSCEKRLTRSLLLLTRYGKQPHPEKMLPKVSQDVLAGMIGAMRSRVNLFMINSANSASINTAKADSTSTLPS
jgi:CRP/FNR family cyclic AMP-dependent transcriptional regulator